MYHQILGYNLILFYYKVVALFFCSSMFAKFLISVGNTGLRPKHLYRTGSPLPV